MAKHLDGHDWAGVNREEGGEPTEGGGCVPEKAMGQKQTGPMCAQQGQLGQEYACASETHGEWGVCAVPLRVQQGPGQLVGGREARGDEEEGRMQGV